MQSSVEPSPPSQADIDRSDAQPMRGLLYSVPIAVVLWSIVLVPLLMR